MASAAARSAHQIRARSRTAMVATSASRLSSITGKVPTCCLRPSRQTQLLDRRLAGVDVAEIDHPAGGLTHFVRDGEAGLAGAALADRIVFAGLAGADGGGALAVEETGAV